MESTRIATNYIVTRCQKRYIAKQKMKAAGMRKICKHYIGTNYLYGKPAGNHRIGSTFASQWRNYVEVE